MLAFYDYRFLSKAFWQQLSGSANRLMRRYLDLGGRTAWFAERALSFEMDEKTFRVVSFDYFPKHLRGVTGADTLQLHLAELEATRIFGLSQTVPVKQTFSLARNFPVAFGQLKKHGSCWFSTSESQFRLAYPGVYGYRLRCVSIGATYADDSFPHRGMLSNHGISMVSRSDGSSHRLARYPDALPLSEFNMQGDMWVYDLPDETLLPFEGSGIETAYKISLSRLGDAAGLENLTDVLLTFDMRASYAATLDARHKAELARFAEKVGIDFRQGAEPRRGHPVQKRRRPAHADLPACACCQQFGGKNAHHQLPQPDVERCGLFAGGHYPHCRHGRFGCKFRPDGRHRPLQCGLSTRRRMVAYRSPSTI